MEDLVMGHQHGDQQSYKNVCQDTFTGTGDKFIVTPLPQGVAENFEVICPIDHGLVTGELVKSKI